MCDDSDGRGVCGDSEGAGYVDLPDFGDDGGDGIHPPDLRVRACLLRAGKNMECQASQPDETSITPAGKPALHKLPSLLKNTTMPFIDWSEDIQKRIGLHLPHWHQSGKVQFVTFRLADSLPQSKVKDLLKIKAEFEAKYPKPWNDEVTRLYHKYVGPISEQFLDNGYGSCMLRAPELRRFLRESFFYGDGKRYDLWAYVIMPNHVHALMSDRLGEDVNDILKSIKQFSANRMNKQMHRHGEVWMHENFDRLVRSDAHFKYCIDYIISNPKYIRQGEYELYVKDGLMEYGAEAYGAESYGEEAYGEEASQPPCVGES